MYFSFINIFYLLLIIHLNLLPAKTCILSDKYEVHVINKLSSDSPQLKIHCQSKNDDLGDHYPVVNEDFNWSFCHDVFGQTLYFCHFWWDSKDKVFDVFDNRYYCVDNPDRPNLTNICKWEVRFDGFYLQQYNDTDKTYYMYHCLDW